MSLALIVVYFILYFFFLSSSFSSNFTTTATSRRRGKKTESDTYTKRQYNMCVVSLCVTHKKHQRGTFSTFLAVVRGTRGKNSLSFCRCRWFYFEYHYRHSASVVVFVAETHNTPATFFSHFYTFFSCDFKNFFSVDAAWLCQLSM